MNTNWPVGQAAAPEQKAEQRLLNDRVEAMLGAIVVCRSMGKHGGGVCKLRYTPPDKPPEVGQELSIMGEPHRVLSVTGESTELKNGQRVEVLLHRGMADEWRQGTVLAGKHVESIVFLDPEEPGGPVQGVPVSGVAEWRPIGAKS